MKQKTLLAWLLAVLLIVLAGDVAWLFVSGLPGHPAPARPTPPPSGANARQIAAYQTRVDRANIRDWDRRETYAIAVGLPIAVFAVCILTGVVLYAERRHAG